MLMSHATHLGIPGARIRTDQAGRVLRCDSDVTCTGGDEQQKGPGRKV